MITDVLLIPVRTGIIAALRAHIAANHNVAIATNALNHILSIPEPAAVSVTSIYYPLALYISSVPPDLASTRTRSGGVLALRKMLDSGLCRNMQALIEGTSGTITIDTDDRSVVCYFFNEKRKTGWLHKYDQGMDLRAMWEQWRKESGVGRLWMEMVGIV